MVEYLDLGLMPLCNNLEPTAELAKGKDRFPLVVMFCKNCGLSQLSVVVDPKVLFSYYTYASGVNQGYKGHCLQMATNLKDRFGLNDKTFHVDIGGNQGTLLLEFQKVLHHEILNVDPSKNMTELARSAGVPSITDFWGRDVVMFKIGKRADLLTATNVFAHLDDVIDFIVYCKAMLRKNSILVIENPYLIDFIDNTEWDTVYHEHVTYWSLLPMMRLCKDYGLKVIDAQKQDIHGGTMRYIIAREESDHIASHRVRQVCDEEIRRGFDQFETYSGWANKVKGHIESIKNGITELKKQGETIIGFAASAKGITMLNACGIDSGILDCIIDETPTKKGKLTPGTGIPIVGIEEIMKINPDCIVILSWNFSEEIMAKVKALGYKGKFIVTVPEFRVIE
jgi:hypothetical protein